MITINDIKIATKRQVGQAMRCRNGISDLRAKTSGGAQPQEEGVLMRENLSLVVKGSQATWAWSNQGSKKFQKRKRLVGRKYPSQDGRRP